MFNKFPLYVQIIGKDGLTPHLNKASGAMSLFGKRAKRIGRNVTLGVGLPAAAAAVAIFNQSEAFAKSMQRVRALGEDVNGENYESLRTLAQDLGGTTVFTAPAAAQALGLLAQAGLTTKEMLATLPHVLDLASASSIELSETAAILAGVMGGYGLGADRARKATDVLALSQKNANHTIEELAEAFKIIGPAASAAEIPFEDTAAAVTLLAKGGIRASLAGTGMKNMLARLAKPSREASVALDELNIQKDKLLDDRGNVRSFTELIKQLEEARPTTGQLTAIFGMRAMTTAQVFIKQGVEKQKELVRSFQKVDGFTRDAAETMMEGAAGVRAKFFSALGRLGDQIAEPGGLLENMTTGIQTATDFIKELSKSNPGLMKLAANSIMVGAVIGPLITMIGVGASALGILTGGLALTGKGLGFIAKSAWRLRPVIAGLWRLITLLPLGRLVTAIAAIGAGIVWVVSTWDSTKSFWSNMGDVFVKLGETLWDGLIGGLKWLADWSPSANLKRLYRIGEWAIDGLVGGESGAQVADVSGSALMQASGVGAPGANGEVRVGIDITGASDMARVKYIRSQGVVAEIRRGMNAGLVTG